MKTQSVTNIRLVEDKERLLLNFVFSLWFEKELEKVNKGSNTKKKKRYAQLDPFKMVVEPPVVFKSDYFYACAADRPGGTLLVDKKVPYLTLETFLEKAKLSDNITQSEVISTLAEAVENKTVTFSLLRDLITSSENLSSNPVYYLTQINEEAAPEPSSAKAADDTAETDDTQTGEGDQEKDTGGGEYYVIFDSKEADPDFESLVSWIFRDYTFEEITFEMVEEGDETYPTKKPDGTEPSAFYTGTVTVKDTTFKEKSFTFNFIDLKLLASLDGSPTDGDGGETDPGGDGGNDNGNGGQEGGDDNNQGIEEGAAYLTTITPNTAFEPVDPKADPKIIGKGTRLTFTKRIDPKRVVLDAIIDDLGKNITADTTLSGLALGEDATALTAFSIAHFDYAFSFKYVEGNHRYFDMTARVGDSQEKGNTASIPFMYQIDDKSITPVVESLDISEGLSKAMLSLSFLDKSGEPITQVVPQHLVKKYKMFDPEGKVTFSDYQTSFGKKDEKEAQNILAFTVEIAEYGALALTFVDPAINPITLDVRDPNKKLTVKLVGQTYEGGKLTLQYNVIEDNESISTEDKKFTITGSPVLVISDTRYEPVTEWTSAGFTNTYDIGTEVDTTHVTLEGQLSVGANEVVVDFTDEIEIGDNTENITSAKISDLTLNGGYIYPSANHITENVCSGSVIVISEANQVTENDLVLVSFIDALGNNITEKASVVFTALNDDGTQFSPTITLTDYQWPMSFDNEGSNGEFECEFKLLGNANSAKSAKGSYKLNYGYEGITPRPINAQLSNNSLNKAKLYVSFIDKYYNTFETGLEQHIAINPPLFGNSEVTYIGYDITYGEDDDNHFGAYIPVNFGKFGDLTLSFADTQFKAVPFSVADPKANYSLVAYNEGFVDSGDYAVRFRLNKDNNPYSLHDGKIISDSIKVNINSQAAKVTGIGWTPDDDAGAVLTVYATLPEGANKSSFTAELTGQFYVGINNVGINIEYTVDHAEV